MVLNWKDSKLYWKYNNSVTDYVISGLKCKKFLNAGVLYYKVHCTIKIIQLGMFWAWLVKKK